MKESRDGKLLIDGIKGKLFPTLHGRITDRLSSVTTDCAPKIGHGLDASMDWIGLDWIGLDWIGSNVGKNLDRLDWIGLQRINDVGLILCYRWSKQVCLDY